MTETTRLDEDSRRALAFIAGNPDGYTRAVMLAHGFSLALTASLIHAGLATDRMPKRHGRGAVARVRITDAGRPTLGDHSRRHHPRSCSFRRAAILPASLNRLLPRPRSLGTARRHT